MLAFTLLVIISVLLMIISQKSVYIFWKHQQSLILAQYWYQGISSKISRYVIFQLIPGIYEGLFRRFQNIEIYIVYCVLCYSLKIINIILKGLCGTSVLCWKPGLSISSTCLYRLLKETWRAQYSYHVTICSRMANKIWLILVNCGKLLHRTSLRSYCTALLYINLIQ